MKHYFLENQSEEIKNKAIEHKFTGPEFVGQGCTQRVGSDSYGYYVVHIVVPGKIVGLAYAESKFITSWTDGHMSCSIKFDEVLKSFIKYGDKPNLDFIYIQKYGKKWYWCNVIDDKIIRSCGNCAYLSWNGAFSYRDPSF